MPRRARYLVPLGFPYRREIIAGSAVLALLAHLLLAQVTLVLAVTLVATGRVSRWRLSWLLVPAGAGAIWVLAVGPAHAVAGFTAGPAEILDYLTRGRLAARTSDPPAALAGPGSWLPGQVPLALIVGAVEAAAAGWLSWLHTDETALPPPRPGVLAVLRGAYATRMIRDGAVLTRDGCALGVVPATGAVAEIRWTEIADGVLVTGTSTQEVVLASLQIVHAALRRRKPLIVIDHSDGPAIARAVTAACAATGTPLLPHAGRQSAPAGWQSAPAGWQSAPAGPASQLWGRGAAHPADVAELPALDLALAVSQRSAVLLTAGSADCAAQACADVAALGADLRRIGVDGDGLVWAPAAERLPAAALAGLIRDGAASGLPVLISTTSPAAATELSALAGAALTFRVAAQRATDQAQLSPGQVPLGPGEFAVTGTTPARRLIRRAVLVPARLPQRTAGGRP